MPTICLATPKGGAGKTTGTIVLACELAEAGTEVTIIDADPNRHVERWAGLKGAPSGITVIGNVSAENILDLIDEAAAKTPFVLIDLEGSANMLVTYAVSRADLVIVPLQGSQLDADEAVKAIKLIRQTEKGFGSKIDFALLFSKMPAAIQSKTYKALKAAFTQANIDVLNTQMIEREAFRSIMSFGGTLAQLTSKEVTNSSAAKENAGALAKEITDRLKANISKKKLVA